MQKFIDGYCVCEDGVIIGKRGRPLTQSNSKEDGSGYLRVGLSINNKPVVRFVHSLVYEAYNGKIKEGLEVDHIDGDRLNNHKDNLQALTHEDNCLKRSTTTLSVSDVVDIKERLRKGERVVDIAEVYGRPPTTISNIKHEVNWKNIH